jgi:transcriptional regulator with XRE-family HTH domain
MTGNQLRALRKKKGLTVAAAAYIVDITPRQWWRWESGKVPVPKASGDLFCLLVAKAAKYVATNDR